MRKEDSSIKKYALYTTNRRKNHRGKARHTCVQLTQQKTGFSIDEMKVKAMNGSDWRHVVGTVDPQAPS